jgi:nucleoside-diphosphate-sugar epimerase
VQDFARDSVLVTGATGFVGAELLRVLIASGVAPSQLRCLVRDADRAVRGGVPPGSVRRGDVTDAASLRAGTADVGLVFHLAGTLKGSRPRDYHAVNAAGTQALVDTLRAQAAHCHVVLVSSLAAAGPSTDGAGTDLPPDRCAPVSAYGESKRQGELALVQSGLSWTIVRPPVVYGPGDAATRLLFRQACAPLCAVPPRPRPLSVVHVTDVVEALLAAGRVRPRGAVLPLDGPERTDTHALLRAIAAACGRRARLLPVPLSVAAAAAGAADLLARLTGRPGFFNGDKVKELRAPGWVADGGAALRALEFRPRIALRDGLAAVARVEGFARGAATSTIA